jgi:hypothetical protein
MQKIEAIIIPFQLDAVGAELGRCGINATLILTDVRQAEKRKRSRSPRTEALDSAHGSAESRVSRRGSPGPESGGRYYAIWSSSVAESQ